MERTKAERAGEETEVKRFSRDHIMKSHTYRDKRDLVMALLQENVEYTLKEVNQLMEQYEKGKVF